MRQTALHRLGVATMLVLLLGFLLACGSSLFTQSSSNQQAATPDVSRAVVGTLTAIAKEEQEAVPTPSQQAATPDVSQAVEATLTALVVEEQEAVPTSSRQNPTPTPEGESEPAIPVDPVPALFSDNFDEGSHRSWQTVQGEWMTVNGRLAPANTQGGVIFAGDPAWTDYTVDVDLYATGGNQFAGMVMVRVQDRNSFAGFVVDCNRGTWWEIVRNGQKEEVPGTRNDKWMCSTPYHLQIVVRGSTYQAFVDNELQSSFSRDLFGSGMAGLQSMSTRKGSLAAFDNFRVSR